MTTNELRLGNLVRHKEFPNLEFTIFGITRTSIQVDSGRMQGYLEVSRLLDGDIDLIPLTEEWLNKFGFEIDDEAGNWHSPDHTIFKLSNGWSVGKLDDFIGWYNRAEDDYYSGFRPQLKFVHQLQNLYFALTGKELELNPELLNGK